MTGYKPVINNAGKHEPIPAGSKLSADTLPISAKPYQAITVQDDGIHVSNAPDVRVTRRQTPENFNLQIERTPATGMQVVRITGTAASTLNNTPVSWDSHPFANKAIIFSGVSGDGVGSAQVANITTTGANITVPRSGPFHLKFEGNY